MTSRLFLILSVCTLAFSGLPALAAMEPDNVAHEVDEAASSCRKMGGRPDTEAMLTVDDLNGDGVEDWVVDYSKLQCAGIPNPFCGSGGCSLQIFLGSPAGSWKMVFDSVVQSYGFGTAAKHRVLRASYGGSECGKVNSATCLRVYRFERGGLSPPPR